MLVLYIKTNVGDFANKPETESIQDVAHTKCFYKLSINHTKIVKYITGTHERLCTPNTQKK